MSEKLLPCPFCGSENIAVGSDKGTVYRHNTAFGDLTRSVPTVRWAYCVDCGCVAPAEKVNNFDGFYKPDEQEDALNRAISAWNRRAQPANEPLTLEQLRQMYDEPVWVVCQASDGREDYTNGYRWGHRNGQIELLRQILNTREGTCESDAHKPGGEQDG